jgi:hypothetical protein
MTIHPSIPAAEATSVTHFICPDGPTENSVPAATHHLAPKRKGSVGRQPSWIEECTYCHKTEKELRESLPLVTGP